MCTILFVYLDEGGELMKFTMKQARRYAGYTQAEMAKNLNVALATYRDYEHGDSEMRVSKAIEFSRIVGIPIENLIFLQTN